MAGDGEEEVPDELECSELVFDLSFHPQADVFACGLVSGAVELYRYGVGHGANTLLMRCEHSSDGSSCRGVQFNADGTLLYTIGADRVLQSLDATGAKTKVFNGAHSDRLSRMFLISEHILATGDDSGEVKVWDFRTSQGEVMSWHLHEDFVSSLAYSEERSTLLSCAGDATLGVYDLRNPANTARSDDQEAELQCLSIMKGGRKVLAGTQDGVILVFSWDRWGDCSDRYPGHPESIDCMLKVDESTVLTGSSDGTIRCVAVQPNKLIGVLGDHEEFPVEGMRADRSGRVLASFSHDNVVRFWDISMFAEDEGEGEGGDGGEDEEGGAAGGRGAVAMEGGEVDNDDGDEEEEEEEEEEEGEGGEMDDGGSTPFDSGSDSDDEDNEPAAGGGYKLKTPAEKFYSDL